MLKEIRTRKIIYDDPKNKKTADKIASKLLTKGWEDLGNGAFRKIVVITK